MVARTRTSRVFVCLVGGDIELRAGGPNKPGLTMFTLNPES